MPKGGPGRMLTPEGLNTLRWTKLAEKDPPSQEIPKNTNKEVVRRGQNRTPFLASQTLGISEYVLSFIHLFITHR